MIRVGREEFVISLKICITKIIHNLRVHNCYDQAYESSAIIDALAIEKEVYMQFGSDEMSTDGCVGPKYCVVMDDVSTYLGSLMGEYPDDIPYILVKRNELSIGDLPRLAEQYRHSEKGVDPRHAIRIRMIHLLMKASVMMSGIIPSRECIRLIAIDLENSCYNASVKISKESEAPPRRQWDSPAFVRIYSSRCGSICGLIDVESPSYLTYGNNVGISMLRMEMEPKLVGFMTEKELCPSATHNEKEEINNRLNQRLVERESNLFKCPHCKVRKCTYKEVQRRGLDEAPDYLCMCLGCGRRFNGRGT